MLLSVSSSAVNFTRKIRGFVCVSRPIEEFVVLSSIFSMSHDNWGLCLYQVLSSSWWLFMELQVILYFKRKRRTISASGFVVLQFVT